MTSQKAGKIEDLPTITLDMHQRVATDNERAHRNYIMLDTGNVWPELISRTDFRTGDWGWAAPIANVEVDLPEMCWGTSHEIKVSIVEAATKAAEKMGLWSMVAS